MEDLELEYRYSLFDKETDNLVGVFKTYEGALDFITRYLSIIQNSTVKFKFKGLELYNEEFKVITEVHDDFRIESWI